MRVCQPTVQGIYVKLTFWLFLAVAQAGLPQQVDARGVVLPKISFGVEEQDEPEQVVGVVKLVVVFTILAMVPSILLMMTCFTRIVVVFHFLRQALGVQQAPPNQVLMGLALFMTFFVMSPVLDQVKSAAVLPYSKSEISTEQAIDAAAIPFRGFMLAQTRKTDLAFFLNQANLAKPDTAADIPMRILIPAFMLSELKVGFQIGFLIFIPFLLIDMVTSSVLMSMGMMMLPPAIVSVPFKLMLFVLVDGWQLIAGSVMKSFI